VYQPGDEQTHIHLIEKGIIKIGSYSPEGERVVYDVLQPGEFFGDLDYLGNGIEFFEFAKAVTSVTVLSVALPFFKHAVVYDPMLSEWFNSNVVRRWWKAETRLLHMTRGDIDVRLDNLRKEYDKSVHDNEGRLHNVFDLLSHQVIADLTGSTRQTVSKKLKEAVELSV
jgi:CRP-like cAMP-binding protein